MRLRAQAKKEEPVEEKKLVTVKEIYRDIPQEESVSTGLLIGLISAGVCILICSFMLFCGFKKY